MDNRLRVSAVPVEVSIGDLDANLHAIRTALDNAEQADPHLIVLTELATSGYVFTDRNEAWQLSMSADDDRLTGLSAGLPADTVVVLGFCERAGGQLFNSALVLTAGGVLGCYRKSHLWAAERTIFAAGTEAGAVIDTPICRLGVAICYDNEFPELPRRLALAGAEVLALPVNWPLVPKPQNEHAPEIVQAMAAARSSRLPTVITDRHGVERGVRWTGGTSIISADGWVCAGSGGGVASAVLELPADKTLGDHNDLFADRRPELYGDITVPVRTTEKREAHVQ